MSWPPVSNGANVIIKGTTTTITWGTGGFVPAAGNGSSTNYSTAIVKSVKVAERNSLNLIEQGAGLTAQSVLILDGLDYEITVEDDSSIVWPIGGQNIGLICPQMGINGVSNTTANIPMEVVNNDYNGARKTAGERVIMAKSYNLFSAA